MSAGPLFSLGQLVATPGALAALTESGENPGKFLTRHANGDWGEVGSDDKRLNDEAIKDGSRLLSAYTLKDGKTKLWIITEAADDSGTRSATTILLPDEY